MYKGISTHNRKTIQLQNEQKHITELQALGYKYSTLLALRRVENHMHHIAEESCNGTITDIQYDAEVQRAIDNVRRLFGGILPRGFFVNGDARGYALKLDDDVVKGFYFDDGENEKLVMVGTENDFLQYIHDHHSYSYDMALKHQGYRVGSPLSRTDWGGYGILAPDFKEFYF